MIPQKKTTKKYLVLAVAALIVGSLDILLAFVQAWWFLGLSPEQVLRFVASGLIGNRAFQAEATIAFLGLLLHFLIAFFWTIIFFLGYPGLRAIVPWKALQGLLYGAFVWAMMNLVVLPLTNAPIGKLSWTTALKEMLILVVAIGLPLAYLAGKYYRKKSAIDNWHRD